MYFVRFPELPHCKDFAVKRTRRSWYFVGKENWTWKISTTTKIMTKTTVRRLGSQINSRLVQPTPQVRERTSPGLGPCSVPTTLQHHFQHHHGMIILHRLAELKVHCMLILRTWINKPKNNKTSFKLSTHTKKRINIAVKCFDPVSYTHLRAHETG